MYVDVNGAKTFYSNGGGTADKQAPAVIFLHGAGMDHSVWVQPARYFARHNYRVFAFDLPNHGRSAGDACTSIDSFSDWLALAMQSLNIEQAALVGHSMGSLIALNFAASYPALVRGIALLGTSTPMPVSDTLLNAARADDHEAIDMSNTWSHSNAAQLGGNLNPGIWMTMAGQRLLEQAGKQVLYTDLNACNEFKNGAELAAEIRCEALVIVGEDDKMTAPVSALKVAAAIPGCRTVRLRHCGHSMLSEQPNRVLDALATLV